MADPLTLTHLLDDAALLSFEHQLHLDDVVGEHEWSADLSVPSFEFRGQHPHTCTAVHLLGSAAPGPQSWLWAWANPSGYPDSVTGLAQALRGFGAQHGIRELAEPEVPFAAFPDGRQDPVGVVAVCIDAAKVFSGRWTSYNADVGGGTRAAFLVEHPDFALPPPDPARVVRVLQQGVTDLRLEDHRRAVYCYATRRKLAMEWTTHGGAVVLRAPGLDAKVDFDEQGRVTNINSSLGG